MGEAARVPTGWRSIDELARLVGWYAWTEHRIFEVAGAWATAAASEVAEAGGVADADEPAGPAESHSPRPGSAEVRVWCAAVSRRHGMLARAWADHLPVRAGIDAAALVEPPPGGLVGAFATLAALPAAGGGASGLVECVLPGLGGVYGRHLATASAASEAAVIEALAFAAGVLTLERGMRELPQVGLHQGFPAPTLLATTFEQAFEEFRVFPAVRAS